GGNYILVANGVLAPANYAVNPEGRSTAFDILVYPTARQEAEDDTKVELLVLHGATDAPTVDVVTGGAVLVNDLVYSDFQGYLAVDAQSYILGITPGNDNNTVLLRYTADLTGLEGGVATVVASGFLDPSTNQSGEGFALIAVLADGTVITL